MVLLTITPAAKSAIESYNVLSPRRDASEQILDEPSLAEPIVGGAISHAQLIEVAQCLREQHERQSTSSGPCSPDQPVRLDSLLKGAKVYTPPPKPKQETTSEYKALMARLRQEEELRAYERMINPPPPQEFSSRAPTSMYAIPDNMPLKEEEDEVTYADINRQLALIINVLVSIIACSVAIWIAARHWSVPQRLALSMTGSGVVAVAEVVIYMGYIRRIQEAKTTEGKIVETKEVVETWVIDSKTGKKALASSDPDGMRFRKGKHR